MREFFSTDRNSYCLHHRRCRSDEPSPSMRRSTTSLSIFILGLDEWLGYGSSVMLDGVGAMMNNGVRVGVVMVGGFGLSWVMGSSR
ncbi:hypothetical protein V6N11_076071 [Hibiscus sabdariffa]|uniref:Uncharacterized protein n=1 Tax=Hibiscus sabdariffa TaxID=183260 RepID=A0ABR2Q554_9ROSI